MSKKIAINIIVLIMTYVLPLYLLYSFQESAIKLGRIQNLALVVLFVGGGLLTFLNNKYRRENINNKWLWLFFIVVGLLGLLYSGLILCLILITKDMFN